MAGTWSPPRRSGLTLAIEGLAVAARSPEGQKTRRPAVPRATPKRRWTTMVELALPKNSRIRTGKNLAKPEDATNVRKFQIYRLEPR